MKVKKVSNLETKVSGVVAEEVKAGEAETEEVEYGSNEGVNYHTYDLEDKAYARYKSKAPAGNVYETELIKLQGRKDPLGTDKSLISIVYGGLNVIYDKSYPESATTKLYGGKYTEEQVDANINLMKVYKPKEYMDEVIGLLGSDRQQGKGYRKQRGRGMSFASITRR